MLTKEFIEEEIAKLEQERETITASLNFVAGKAAALKELCPKCEPKEKS